MSSKFLNLFLYYFFFEMIRLANPVKVFKSPRLTQPTLNSGSAFTTHVINHPLAAIPDRVDVIFEPSYLVHDYSYNEDHIRGYYVNSVTSTTVNLRMYRWDTGDFYAIISSRTDGNFDFS